MKYNKKLYYFPLQESRVSRLRKPRLKASLIKKSRGLMCKTRGDLPVRVRKIVYLAGRRWLFMIIKPEKVVNCHPDIYLNLDCGSINLRFLQYFIGINNQEFS